MTAAPTLDVRMVGAVMVLTLDRPDRLNAITEAGIDEILAALDEADARDEVRAVVLTGRGRAFCAGADLSAGGDTFDPGEGEFRDYGGVLTLRMFCCRKPLIAAVNGDAVGFGASLLLPTDVRLAVPTARIGFVFARRGIVPESCSSWFLPRAVGLPTALRWMMSGALVPAEEAAAAGLVTVVPADRLLEEALATAHALTDSTAAVSVAATRLMVWRAAAMTHPYQAHLMESAALAARGAHPDAVEGVTAFLERRAADFPGRPSVDLAAFDSWFDEPTSP